MTDQSTYVERIMGLGWDELQALWTLVKKRETPHWPPGKAFEHLVLRAFQLDGAEVRWPYEVRGAGRVRSEEIMEQIDGAVCADGLWCLIECKDTEDPVNVAPIAKLRNQLLRRPSPAVGLLFSANAFTSPALVLASFVAPQTILLWDGDDIEYCLSKRKVREPLLRKYRACIEEGRADLGLPEEEAQ